MPTTSEASTPSRRAIRKAESKWTPVVNQLQLRLKFTLISYLRQPDHNWSDIFALEYLDDAFGSNHSTNRCPRALPALLVGTLLAGPERRLARPSPRKDVGCPTASARRKTSNEAQRAEAEGRSTMRWPPTTRPPGTRRRTWLSSARSATLRSQLVRAHVDNAEQLRAGGRRRESHRRAARRHADRSDERGGRRTHRADGQRCRRRRRTPPQPAQIQGLPQTQGAGRQAQLRPARRHQDRLSSSGTRLSASRRRSIPTCRRAACICACEDVDFKTAMYVLAQQTGTFWRPVDANLIFVAADTTEKRRQFGVQAEQIVPAVRHR